MVDKESIVSNKADKKRNTGVDVGVVCDEEKEDMLR